MVKRYSDDGRSSWHEPPYTKAEEADLYRRINSAPIAVLHPARAKANQEGRQTQPPAKEPSQD